MKVSQAAEQVDTFSMEKPTSLRSPRTIADLTAPWLTEALSIKYPGVIVETCVTEEEIWGMAVKVRVRLTYNERGRALGLPETMMVKGGFGAHPMPMEVAANNPELLAYQRIVPLLNVSTPEMYYAGIDEDGFVAMVMEDLIARGARFCAVQSPLSYEQAIGFLNEFAAIHARWWDSPEIKPGGAIDFVPDVMRDMGDIGAMVFFRRAFKDEHWAEAQSWPRYHALPRPYRDRERMQAAIMRLKDIWQDQTQCVLHGDEHLGNLFTDADGRHGMIDWHCKRGPWAVGFAYFLIPALDLEDRRRWEIPLLEHYLERLRQLGVATAPFEEALLAYRQAILFGLMVWLTVPPHIPIRIELRRGHHALRRRSARSQIRWARSAV